jgi:phytoene dehydrogenase-like protein
MHKVLIVGAGPAGLLLATRLAKRKDICVTIYDEERSGGGGCMGANNDVKSPNVPECCADIALGAMRVAPTLTRTLALFKKLGVETEPFGFTKEEYLRHDGKTVLASDTVAVNRLFGVEPETLDLAAQPVVAANALLAACTGLPPNVRTVNDLLQLSEPERINVLRPARWRARSLSNTTWGEVLSAFVGDTVRIALQALTGFDFLSQSDMNAFTFLLMLTSWAVGGVKFDAAVRPVNGFSDVFRKIRIIAREAGVRFETGRAVRVTRVSKNGRKKRWCVEFANGCVVRTKFLVLAIDPNRIAQLLEPHRIPRDAPLITVPVTKALLPTMSEGGGLPECRVFVIRDAMGRQLFRWCSGVDGTNASWMSYYSGAFGLTVRGMDAQGWNDQLRAFGLADAILDTEAPVQNLERNVQFWSKPFSQGDQPSTDPGNAMRRWALGLGTNLFCAHSFLSTSWQAWLEGSLQLLELIEPALLRAITNSK